MKESVFWEMYFMTGLIFDNPYLISLDDYKSDGNWKRYAMGM